MRRAVKAGVWRVRRVPFCEPRLPLDDICGAFAKAKPSSIGGKVLIYIVSRHTRSPRVIKAEARGMRRSNVAHALARGPEYQFVQGGLGPSQAPSFGCTSGHALMGVTGLSVAYLNVAAMTCSFAYPAACNCSPFVVTSKLCFTSRHYDLQDETQGAARAPRC